MTILVDRQTVLFVDDDEKLRQANAQTLELAGIDVRPVAGAEQAASNAPAVPRTVVSIDRRVINSDRGRIDLPPLHRRSPSRTSRHRATERSCASRSPWSQPGDCDSGRLIPVARMQRDEVVPGARTRAHRYLSGYQRAGTRVQ